MKKDQLSLITRFFITSLNFLDSLVKGEKVFDASIERVEDCFDKLIAGRNAYKLSKLIDQYTLMEKIRWKIIGGKD